MVSNLMMGKNFRKLNLKLNFVDEHEFDFFKQTGKYFLRLRRSVDNSYNLALYPRFLFFFLYRVLR